MWSETKWVNGRFYVKLPSTSYDSWIILKACQLVLELIIITMCYPYQPSGLKLGNSQLYEYQSNRIHTEYYMTRAILEKFVSHFDSTGNRTQTSSSLNNFLLQRPQYCRDHQLSNITWPVIGDTAIVVEVCRLPPGLYVPSLENGET